MKIKAIIHPAEEGGYWAEVPALPGCITEGDTMEEVVSNLQDAIQGWLEVANESQPTDFLENLSVPSKLSNDIPRGTLAAIWKQAQLGDRQ
jgi:predicted RNase H-like HicB family nuclease